MKNLEERLRETGKLDEFNSDLSKLKDDDSRNLIKLVLGIALNLHENGLENDYTFYGGYSVLMHLVNTIGKGAIYGWRGSYDLDIVCNNRIRYHLQRYIKIVSDRTSPNIRGKRTIRVKPKDSEKSYKIDLRMKEAFKNEPHEVYEGETEIIYIYGVPVKALNLIKQFKSKLDTNRGLERDDIDIVNLLYIFYRKNYECIEIIKNLEHKQKQRLYNLLKVLNENYIIKNVLFIKGDNEPLFLNYINNFKDRVRKEK